MADSQVMKALRITKSDSGLSIAVEEVSRPIAKPGHLLIKIRASAINPSDVLNSQGKFPETTFPRTPGRDFAGTIVDGSPSWVGKDIFGTSGPDFSFTEDGAHAEYCLVRESAVVMKFENITFPQAASLGVSFTAASIALQRADVKSTDCVLVLGATGAVGSMAVELARAKGCQVLKAARRGDVDINLKNDPNLGSARSKSGNGPDVVIDTVGDEALLRSAISIMNNRGRYSFITAPRGGNGEVAINMLQLYRKQIVFVGSNTVAYQQEELSRILGGVEALVESGKLTPLSESSMNFITLEAAVDAYKTKGRHVIVFD